MCITISQKKRFKKMLINGFNNLDYDDIRMAICGLLDYDEKYSTQKLNKYLNKIILEFKNNEDKLNINENNLKEAVGDLTKLSNIFDLREEEEEELEDVLDIKMNEVMKRRKEVLIRRIQIEANRIGIIKKKQRRHIGGMG